MRVVLRCRLGFSPSLAPTGSTQVTAWFGAVAFLDLPLKIYMVGSVRCETASDYHAQCVLAFGDTEKTILSPDDSGADVKQRLTLSEASILTWVADLGGSASCVLAEGSRSFGQQSEAPAECVFWH